MAPSYLSPGVYVEEVDGGTKPIESVGTAVAAFVGYTQKAADPRNGASLLGKPTLVTNWTQYVNAFGGFAEGAYLPEAVYGYFLNGGSRAYVVSVKVMNGQSAGVPTALLTSGDAKNPVNVLKLALQEGGTTAGSVKVTSTVNPPAKEGEQATFTLVVQAGRTRESYENLSLKRDDKNFVETAVNTKSKLVTVEVVGDASVLPAGEVSIDAGAKPDTKPVSLTDYQGNAADRTGLGGLEALQDVTMLIAPDLMSAYQAGELDAKGVQGVQQAMIDFCESTRYVFAILDCPPGLNPQEVYDWRMMVNYDTSRAALYYPWIEVVDNVAGGGKTHFIPPAGHMAGVYARTDETRGVHKAPANEIVRGALGLEINVTKGEQDGLNPHGINCIRSFPGYGIRIWGARTLSSDPSWRYINVRRLFNMVEQSIERGIQWAVFEPNDYDLWARLRRNLGSYLKVVWRSGALFGRSPEEAFYVKCDEETNPPELRDLGQLVVEVGIRPVKPAEFLIIRISQWAPEDGSEG
jgi:hypothetical protein